MNKVCDSSRIRWLAFLALALFVFLGVRQLQSPSPRKVNLIEISVGKPVENYSYPSNFTLVRRHRPTGSLNSSSITILAEFNYAISTTPSQRLAEIQEALAFTLSEHPDALHVFVTSLPLVEVPLFPVPHDLYETTAVAFGSPIELGSRYPGWKIAGSIDDGYPASLNNFTAACKQQGVVYALSRADESGSCLDYRENGGFDGFLFAFIPECALRNMTFSRQNWGSEALASYLLVACGVHVPNMCPDYWPIHYHRSAYRPGGRVRVNDPDQSFPVRDPIGPFCRIPTINQSFLSTGNQLCVPILLLITLTASLTHV